MGSLTSGSSGHWSYDMLKEIAATDECTLKELEELKSFYANDIGSPRRLDCVRSVPDLLDALERRNIISEYNVKPLQVIGEYCPKLDEALANYILPKENTTAEPINQYKEQRLTDDLQQQLRLNVSPAIAVPSKEHFSKNVSIAATNTSPSAFPVQLTERKLAAIQKLLATELGRNWRNFGRELQISEGTMDDIELKFPNDSSSRVYKMLLVFQEDECHDPKHTILIICRALAGCRRKDLRIKVENIMSH